MKLTKEYLRSLIKEAFEPYYTRDSFRARGNATGRQSKLPRGPYKDESILDQDKFLRFFQKYNTGKSLGHTQPDDPHYYINFKDSESTDLSDLKSHMLKLLRGQSNPELKDLYDELKSLSGTDRGYQEKGTDKEGFIGFKKIRNKEGRKERAKAIKDVINRVRQVLKNNGMEGIGGPESTPAEPQNEEEQMQESKTKITREYLKQLIMEEIEEAHEFHGKPMAKGPRGGDVRASGPISKNSSEFKKYLNLAKGILNVKSSSSIASQLESEARELLSIIETHFNQSKDKGGNVSMTGTPWDREARDYAISAAGRSDDFERSVSALFSMTSKPIWKPVDVEEWKKVRKSIIKLYKLTLMAHTFDITRTKPFNQQDVDDLAAKGNPDDVDL